MKLVSFLSQEREANQLDPEQFSELWATRFNEAKAGSCNYRDQCPVYKKNTAKAPGSSTKFILKQREMSKKQFNGKAIYNPSGKAGEYSYWACNFYVGCSNMCEYCYCKKGILSNVMGQNKAQLKMCFKDEADALMVFKKNLFRIEPRYKSMGYSLALQRIQCWRKHINYTGRLFTLQWKMMFPLRSLQSVSVVG